VGAGLEVEICGSKGAQSSSCVRQGEDIARQAELAGLSALLLTEVGSRKSFFLSLRMKSSPRPPTGETREAPWRLQKPRSPKKVEKDAKYTTGWVQFFC
jgi:hypothetical protein